MKKIALCVVIMSAFLFSAKQAKASPNQWSSVASACVIDTSNTTGTPLVNAADGSVRFAANSTGQIDLTCAVTIPLSSSTCGTYLGFVGSTPSASGFAAYASLNKAPFGSGSTVTNLAFVTATSSIRSLYTGVISGTYDFTSNVYYVNLLIQRGNTTTASPVLYSVAVVYPAAC
jgi:hypothetical protein